MLVWGSVGDFWIFTATIILAMVIMITIMTIMIIINITIMLTVITIRMVLHGNLGMRKGCKNRQRLLYYHPVSVLSLQVQRT